MKRLLFFPTTMIIVFLSLCKFSTAQTIEINPELLTDRWQAWWIAAPDIQRDSYGVYHFRKKITLDNIPHKFIVHVSADNRYKLFVNGVLASLGPARSDVYNWAFETVDIAPFLKAGENIISSVVWFYAGHAPVAQMSFNRVGFILQGDGKNEQMINTNNTWKCIRNDSYSPINTDLQTYFVVGPGEKIVSEKYPWGWEQAAFDDSSWPFAKQDIIGGGKGSRDYPGWLLVPRAIPQQEMKDERILKLRRAENMPAPVGFPEKKGNYVIPASSSVSLLLDQTYLTTAYLNMLFSGGKDSKISIKYAESLYNSPPNDKGNRDQIDGKTFWGYEDIIIADGGEQRQFTSLWWRTYRYILLEIKTGNEPLMLNDIYGTYTGYPFELASKFSAPAMTELDKILAVGWRTARLCAHETYMDCPYYEQLQYFGDTRIQAMVTLYNTRDDRLVRNAIDNGRQSIIADGITMSRYPTYLHQFTPSFSIWWISIVHDYWMHRSDDAYIASQLPFIRAILDYYEQRLKDNNSLSYIRHWFFTDWADGFIEGEPPRMADGNSSVQDLHFLTGLQYAIDLERSLGMTAFADHYEKIASKIKQGFKEKYWDEGRKLFADTPEKKTFSQHANIMSILTGVVEGKEAEELMEYLMKDKDMTQASVYFKYYLNRALDKTGMGDRYIDMLDIWRSHLANGLTTWAESPEPARSDCHAWGSSPNIELYRIVLGINSDAPGFKKVLIAPKLGKLLTASGCIPHPDGDICVSYKIDKNGKINADITLPRGISGKFVWKGKSVDIQEGKQIITL